MKKLKSKQFGDLTVLPDGGYIWHDADGDVRLTPDEAAVLDASALLSVSIGAAGMSLRRALALLGYDWSWLDYIDGTYTHAARYIRRYWRWSK